MCDKASDPQTRRLIDNYTKLQLELSHKVIAADTEDWTQDLDQSVSLIGGLDISYDKSRPSIGCVTCIVLDAKQDLRIVYEHNSSVEIVNEYIAGFLAFREIEFLVKEYHILCEREPTLVPQVWLIDGNGQLHPRKFGLASHFGLLTDSSVIGVAKNPYYLTFVDQRIKSKHKSAINELKAVGDRFDIKNSDDEVIGVALKTSAKATNPVYVSVGHKISLSTAIRLVLKCCKFRIPEPTRMADIISRQAINR